MKKITVSIGIPAYNEEANIKILLKALLRQKIKNTILCEIIVISDGSTDGTVLEAKSVGDRRIKIISRKKRLGILKTQNEILKHSHGDILVLVDADILPANDNFIEEIIKPIIKNKNISLVGADTQSTNPETFFEKIIAYSHIFKNYLYKEINYGNNIYLCHGRARAFSKSFYSNLKWPEFPPEDAFSYLSCIQKGGKFIFAPKAKVVFQSPSTFKDYLKQSTRFFAGRRQMEKYFPTDFVRSQYHIPKILLINSILKHFFKNPRIFGTYLLIVLYIRIFGFKHYHQKIKWDISPSTKRINLQNV